MASHETEGFGATNVPYANAPRERAPSGAIVGSEVSRNGNM
jgi:hypothetical protein